MGWDLKRKKTAGTDKRIKSLEDQMVDSAARLDAAVAESKRLAKALNELLQRDPLHDLQKTLRERFSPPRPDEMDFNPDDTIN